MPLKRALQIYFYLLLNLFPVDDIYLAVTRVEGNKKVNINYYLQSLAPRLQFRLIVEADCAFCAKVSQSLDLHSKTAHCFNFIRNLKK